MMIHGRFNVKKASIATTAGKAGLRAAFGLELPLEIQK
jgi:hypothetical protein